MSKIKDYILSLSPKKLAIFLVLGPLVLFLTHTILLIGLRSISNPSTGQVLVSNILLGIHIILIAIIVLMWLTWLKIAVAVATDVQLGINRKWFHIAFKVLCLFVFFTIGASSMEYLAAARSWKIDYLSLISASREFVNFGGIMIAYPVVCHYAARAATAKRNKKPATFIQALPFTLFLIFGTVVGVPFLHNYLSEKTSANSELMRIYAFAVGLCIITFIIGLAAAITGLV